MTIYLLLGIRKSNSKQINCSTKKSHPVLFSILEASIQLQLQKTRKSTELKVHKRACSIELKS